jgi:hypothetical protein
MKVRVKKSTDTIVSKLEGVGIDDNSVCIFIRWYNENFIPVSDVDKLEYLCNGKWKEIELWENEDTPRKPEEIYNELEKLFLKG